MEHVEEHFDNFGNFKKRHVNIMKTFWKLGENTFGTPKFKRIKIVFEISFQTIPKNKMELNPA